MRPRPSHNPGHHPDAKPPPNDTHPQAAPDITYACPQCSHRPDHFVPRCPQCGADLAELFSATYRLPPSPWARWVAWAVLLMLAATVLLAGVALILDGKTNTEP